jgi:hypothetical protein
VACRTGSRTYGGHAPHEPRTGLQRDFGALLELFVVWEDSLRRELLNLRLPVVVPVVHVVIPPHAQRPAREDHRGDGVFEARADDEVLVLFRGARLDGGDEAGANP